jgi:hypothetical protein
VRQGLKNAANGGIDNQSANGSCVMQKQRRSSRKPLLYHLRVLNRKSGRTVGYLGNITTEGIMLFSEKPIRSRPDRPIPLRIIEPEEREAGRGITLDARRVWGRKDPTPGLYATGLEIEKISSGNRHRIEALITNWNAAV